VLAIATTNTRRLPNPVSKLTQVDENSRKPDIRQP
jgi:hypothetical protein